MKLRVGIGYDVHQLKSGYKFVLGGIKLDHDKGCVAHSDGDVLIHAICDALLGAANLRDIGYLFPDSDPEYKDIDSKILLKKTAEILESRGFFIENIDSTVCLEKPKIKDKIPEMQKILSQTMGIPFSDISIKATTTEKLGFVGKEDGISATAIVLVRQNIS